MFMLDDVPVLGNNISIAILEPPLVALWHEHRLVWFISDIIPTTIGMEEKKIVRQASDRGLTLFTSNDQSSDDDCNLKSCFSLTHPITTSNDQSLIIIRCDRSLK
jgi:hypothetical protein